MEFHELSQNYPLMPKNEFQRFKEGMREHGYDPRFPIVIFQGKILDGRNRFRAATEIGMKMPPTTEFTGTEEEARHFVETANEERRHLPMAWLKRHRKERIERIAAARREGESTRAIAEKEGISQARVRADLEKASEQGCSLEPESGTVKGKDGKKRSAKKKKSPRKNGSEDHPSNKTNTIPTTPETDTPPSSPGGSPIILPTSDDVEPVDSEAKLPEFDEYGIPIQPHALEAFKAVDKFKELKKALRKAQQLFNEVANLPGGVFLTRSPIASCRRGKKGEDGEYASRFIHPGLERAMEDVKNCTPTHTVCPWNYVDAPHPDDCSTCMNLNWTPPLSSNTPPDIADKEKEVFGV